MRSRISRYFQLTLDLEMRLYLLLNIVILVKYKALHHIISSVVKVKIAGIFHNVQTVIPIRYMLEAIGYL